MARSFSPLRLRPTPPLLDFNDSARFRCFNRSHGHNMFPYRFSYLICSTCWRATLLCHTISITSCLHQATHVKHSPECHHMIDMWVCLVLTIDTAMTAEKLQPQPCHSARNVLHGRGFDSRKYGGAQDEVHDKAEDQAGVTQFGALSVGQGMAGQQACLHRLIVGHHRTAGSGRPCTEQHFSCTDSCWDWNSDTKSILY